MPGHADGEDFTNGQGPLRDNRLPSLPFPGDLRGLTLSSCAGTSNACTSSGSGETNVFNGFGDLISRTSRANSVSRGLSYQYDKEGNRTRVTHPGGSVYFSYGRDGLNRMCSIGESAAAPSCTSSAALMRVTYRPSGGRLDLIRPGGATTNLEVDNALRLGSFTQNFSGTANDLTNQFFYNPASQITTLSQSNSLYTYNQLGSRTGAYGVNGLNQVTSIGGTSNTLSYDTNGNLTADVGANMTYVYDMENRLMSTGGATASTFDYDVLGRLSRLTVGGTTTDFHYDGDALVGEYEGTTLTRRYVHGDQVDEPLIQYNGASVGGSHRRYLHADHQGSIIAHSSNTGAVLQTNSYDAYGIPKTTNEGRFGYTGQAWIPQLGLNYYKARIYSPKLGRFLQTDPIFYSDDMNMYAYVGNDPANATDPTGLTIRVGGLSPETQLQVQLDQLRFMEEASSGESKQEESPQGQQPEQKPVDPPCSNGPGYGERYVDWTSDHFIDPGAAASLLLLGVWPKSLAPATGGRPPLLGSNNPLTSVPRAVGIPGAGSPIARTGAAGIGLATMFVGMYDATIAVSGFFYAIPNYGGGSCKKSN